MIPSDTTARHVATEWQESGPLGRFVQPIDRIGRLAALVREAEEQIAREVAAARTQGATWREIGNALGVTRQAAHLHYA